VTKAIQDNLSAVFKRLSRKGDLVLKLVISREGKIQGVDLEKTSGILQLDEMALGAVTGLPTLRPFPNGLASRKMILHVPVVYQ
jgi:TonB family protein